MPIAYIIRGLPGSGKSTIAKKLGCFHVEADMYHMKDGKYQWTPEANKRAHLWCKSEFMGAVSSGIDVAVSNTFTMHWEMEPYIKYATEMGYDVKVIRATGNFGNVHDVPYETQVRMRERFEPYEGELTEGDI